MPTPLTPDTETEATHGRNASVQLTTLAISAAGGTSFALVGVPGGYLSGAILAGAAAALSGAELRVSQSVRNVALTVLGMVVATTITQETLRSLPQWPVSILALATAMAGLIVVLPRYFTRVHDIDTPTARLCAIPGALSLVLALADDLAVDERRVAVLQSLRLALLMVLVPLAVGLGMSTGDAVQAPTPLLAWSHLLIVVVFSLAGIMAARKLGMPAPYLTGPMLLSGTLFATGTYDGRLPEPLVAAAFIVLGASVGARFAGIDRAYLMSCVGAGAGGIGISVALTGMIAWPAAVYLGIPFIQVWLALAPGGLDTMIALALAMGVDPAFVAGHQFLRLIGLFMIVPFLFRGARRAQP